MSYAPLSRSQHRARFLPDAHGAGRSHDPARACREEFLIIEGEAIEDDGTILKLGDWIVYEPGTRHNTRTITGCLLLGLDWDPRD